MSKEIGEEYASSLSDLTVNSKPLINMLTILAEENIEHAAVIVKAVEKHLEKVRRDIKLPVLYLVDSIIKNVGGAYTQLFAQIIVNMFCLTFKQVDEKTRSQMFKLRETWHDVFPAIKLYQLDVKVNLVDPAWPIQAQPPQSNIHVNPNFLKKPMATSQSVAAAGSTTSVAAPSTADATGPTSDEEKMRSALAMKEQELLQLQRRKIEMELEQTRRQLAEQRKALERTAQQTGGVLTSATGPVTVPVSVALDPAVPTGGISVKQRLGPPVSSVASKPVGAPRIAPVRTAQLSHTRRRPDPRLARQATQPSPPAQPPIAPVVQPPIAPNVFDIKPLEKTQRVMTKSRNAITIDVVPPPGIPDHVKNESKRREVRKDPRLERRSKPDSENRRFQDNTNHSKSPTKQLKSSNHKEVSILPAIADSKIISKLPPIPRISKTRHQNNDDVSNKNNESAPSPVKRRKDNLTSQRSERKSRKNKEASVEKSYSPEKTKRSSSSDVIVKIKPKSAEIIVEDKVEADVPVTFKELKNSTKERNYMRRNREKSESPEKAEIKVTIEDSESHVTEESVKEPLAEPTKVINNVVGSKDVDLRVLPKTSDSIAAVISRKRTSADAPDIVTKKSKADKFDILFGDEDVDLRTLQPIERQTTPPPPLLTKDDVIGSPKLSIPKVKEVESPTSPVTSPTKLDVVRAKLAEATKGKDRLGRPLLYKKLPDDPDERKRTMSMNSEDTDMRSKFNADVDSDGESFDTSIKIIMSQADEQLKVGDINKQQYNVLMMQVLHLNEKQKLKEAKQRESLEASKRKLSKLQAGKDASASPNIEDEDVSMSPRSGPDSPPPPRKHNSPTSFGDIDERVVPLPMHMENNTQAMDSEMSRFPGLNSTDAPMDSDLRVPPLGHFPDILRPDCPSGPGVSDIRFPMRPPMNRMNFLPFQPMWRGPRPRMEDWNGPRNHLRMRGPMPPPFWRNQFDGRMPFDPRMPEPRMPMPPFPPLVGMKQGECPIIPYKNEGTDPPLLGGPASRNIPPTDIKLLEYIDQDIMRTIDVDGVPREIRYYGETAIVMLDWDDPRDITFLPGSRRVTFDDKETFLLNFNDDYTTIELEDQTFRVKFGTPTRELYINERWFECFFGGPPLNVMIDGKVRMVQIEGPAPKVKVGLVKRTDLVAGKINIIVDATSMFPVFLDAKPQKFHVSGAVLTVRFVDSLETVLINEKPFKVEFGGLPQPILVGKRRHFIRFSVLPRTIKPGQVDIKDMEGKKPMLQLEIPTPVTTSDNHVHPFAPIPNATGLPLPSIGEAQSVQPSHQNEETENTTPSGGLDMLASLMASSTAPTSQLSGYSLNEPSAEKPAGIPGLETSSTEPTPAANIGLPFLPNINVNDLFAKLVATGIVSVPTAAAKSEVQTENPSQPSAAPKPEVKTGRFERRNEIKRVDLLKPETLKVAQPGLISRLYGGMQCSGCGVRFPPERTVRYSQHLDWHFRQNRRERQSARRAHSRHWHYDLSDWLQYEEIEDIEEREKSWFESQGTAGAANSNNPITAADGSNLENPTVSNAEQEALSVPAGLAPEDHLCALCGDKFDQFYNEDKEEWHLRKAVRYEEKNYHPLCFDDYKASLTLDESALETNDLTNEDVSKEDTKDEEVPMETETSDVIIQDADDDNDSVVEIISETPSEQVSQDSVPVDQEEDDDVVLKTEPVEQVLVDDEDTDEETERAREALDRAAVEEFDFTKVKVKLEPADPDDEPVITAEEELVTAQADTTHTSVMSSIDGNVQLEATQVTPALPIGGIRINITKSIPHVTKEVPEDSNSGACEELPITEEPLPPGEEPEIEYKLKPGLENVNFNKQVPVQRGTELSGLCSIM